MFGTMQFYLFVVLGIFLVGEVIGIATKGKLSGIMVAFLIFLAGFLTGVLPPDIIDKAGLTIIAKWCPAMVIFNLGSGVNIRQLIQEWRTLAMACICMVCSIIIIFCCSPLIGMDSALVSIPVVNGGTIATQIMTEGALEKGLTIAAALAAVIYALQKLVGAPLASYFGVREANRLLEEFRKDPEGHMAALQAGDKSGKGPARVPFYQKHKAFYSSTVMIGITAFFAYREAAPGATRKRSHSLNLLIIQRYKSVREKTAFITLIKAVLFLCWHCRGESNSTVIVLSKLGWRKNEPPFNSGSFIIFGLVVLRMKMPLVKLLLIRISHAVY